MNKIPGSRIAFLAAVVITVMVGTPVSLLAASFTVWPVDDWVQSRETWTPDATISLTIEDGSVVVYSDTQAADSNGYFSFNLLFNLERGHVVTISDGTTTKTHTVTNLFVDGVDVTGDAVFGRADAGTSVEVWVHSNDGVTATADGSGEWIADFSSVTDLTYLSEGGLEQTDADGDSTGIWWTSPRFQVAPVDDWVRSWRPWTPGATISLIVLDGVSMVYSDSQTADSDGNFAFYLWNVFDLERGHVVTVSDGTTTKTHTVANLFVDGVDVTGDNVFGRADAGTSVYVSVHGGGVTATADGAGEWIADFSGMTDLTYLSEGTSRQTDSEGDSTRVMWASPRFEVAPVDDWVESGSSWTPGATISLTIEDGSGVLYSDSQTANTRGHFDFDLWDVFDLERGHIVTVSDGTTTKTHTVTNLFVDGVDVTGDAVFGRADAGSSVDVWVHGNGRVTATADGSGEWIADFSGMTDLTYLSDGGSSQTDSDGDSTGVWWASPSFQVVPVGDWVASSKPWRPGATISLTIEDGGGVVYSDSQTADAHGDFEFDLLFNLERGHVVTVSDGTTTKTHTVANLFVDGVDVTGDAVFGRADAGSSIEVWEDDNGGVTATADGFGDWIADFSGMTDLTYLSEGDAEQTDSDGDSTRVQWDSPSFQVAPVADWVQSSRSWTPGATISLTIEDGSGVMYSDSKTADTQGNFNFDLWNVFDLERGHVVTVSDGTTTKTHTVANLFVDGVDVTGDDVFGRTDAGTSVDVWVHGNGRVTATADGSGEWIADFSGLTDLTYLSDGGSEQTDSDGDSTGVWWTIPSFQVAPANDWVGSSRSWTPGATISLTIEDGSGVVYSDSQTADSNGYFNFYLQNVFNLEGGHVVTISDGTTTKTHTVTNLFVDGVDVTGDSVFGRADAGTLVEVWVHDNGSVTVAADGFGNWIADFSGMTDLTYLSDGGSQQIDSDGDSTGVWWHSPSFQVEPVNDWVGASRSWRAGATISLTIEDGSGVVYSDSLTAHSNGYFNFNLRNVFNLERGHVVTISDGTTTKTHTVTNLFVDGVDVTGDAVFGRADAGTLVDVWIRGNGEVTVTADGFGEWIADFSGMTDLTYLSTGGSRQTDAEGDSTWVGWDSPSFQVAPLDEWVQSWRSWTPGATISLTIEDGSGVVYSDSQTANTQGNFFFDLSDVFHLERGHVVTVSDGTATKTHTVANLFVDGVDVTGDTVFGRADAGTSVDVWVHGNGRVTATADGAGEWIADFSGVTDLTYFSDGSSGQTDSDGDSTWLRWASPRFEVAPVDDWVESKSSWTPGATISLTIEDGSGVVYSDSQTADTDGDFEFNLRDVFDLERGHVVTVSDGTTTKTHTVANLFVDGVDVTGDAVFGRADAGTSVEVEVDDYDVTATADGAGDWIADFSGMTDLTTLSDGDAEQTDSEGDSTWVQWASPSFHVAPVDDWVQSWNPWTPNATISLTIEDGSGVVYSDSQTADTDGRFNFDLWNVFDLERGHVVTVSGGTTTKTHTVANLFVDGVDVTGDDVFGRADAGALVYVWVQIDDAVTATADGSGEWIADFSGMTDLTYLSDGGSGQLDSDGDWTGVWWRASPGFEVFRLTVNPAGSGSGTIISTPSGIDCGSICQEDFSQGTVVQLTANPSAGSFFAGWTGDIDCSDGEVTIEADTTCTATFDSCSYALAPMNRTYSAAGGSDSFSLTTPAGCTWLSSTTAAWITIDSGSGNGNGTVACSVSPNPNPSQRTDIITVAGESFTVTQLGVGGGCPGPNNLVLSNDTISTPRLYEGCSTVTAGPNFSIVNSANVTFRAGDTIILRDGFKVEPGAKFKVEIDPSLEP